MLDPPSQVLAVLVVLLERVLVDVQHFAVARDRRSRARRPDSRDRSPSGRAARIVSSGGRVEPRAVRLVGVRLEQPRAARSERAVAVHLDRAHGEHGCCRSRSSGDCRGRRRTSAPCCRAPSPTGARCSLPSSIIRFIRSMTSNDEPASWNDRDALRRHFLVGQLAAARRASVFASSAPARCARGPTPSRAAARSDCRSRPSGSRRRPDSPSSSVMPDSSIAF